MSNYSSKTAFTLAEVLITLGIIGIVAALILPFFMANIRKSEYSNKLKKLYSIISQAVLMSEIQTGLSALDWERNGMINNEDGTSDVVANEEESYNFFIKYLAPSFKYTSIVKGGYIEENGRKKFINTKVYLVDGTVLVFTNGSCFDIVADLNGNRMPNKGGIDIYRFLLCQGGAPQAHFGNKNQSFGTYMPVHCPTREIALQKCKENSSYCSTLLMYDNWKFKDDYPYKL